MGGLIVIEPDLGTAIVIGLALAAILVASGVKLRHLAIVAGVLLFAALVFAIAEPYRRERLTSFLDPWADTHGAGFQSVQAMIAIGSGGPFGVGLGGIGIGSTVVPGAGQVRAAMYTRSCINPPTVPSRNFTPGPATGVI